MNLTVGPLPPAVYWRRRAIVAAGLLVVILLFVFKCGGSGTSDSSGARKTAVTNGVSPSPSSASPLPSTSTPVTLPSYSLPPSSPPPSPSATVGPGGVPVCSDQDIQVTATIESTSVTESRLQYGGTFALKLKVKNVSSHTCTRDVGTVPEELKIMQGSRKIWSSNDCDGATGARAHDVRTFAPNIMIFAMLTWNSYLNTAQSCTKGTTPAAKGTYQLYGRVGTATSQATEFKIVS